jgi:hypothetical protein
MHQGFHEVTSKENNGAAKQQIRELGNEPSTPARES